MAHDELEGVDPQPRPLGSFTGERHCLNCRSVEFLAGLHEYKCLRCGVMQYADGTPVMPELLFLVPSEANRGSRGMESPDQLYSWEELFAMERGESLGVPVSGGPPGASSIGDGSD